MKTVNRYFSITPKVILSNTTTEITIKPLAKHALFNDEIIYEYYYYPLERFNSLDEYEHQEMKLIRSKNGIIKINQYFIGEQEHKLLIKNPNTNENYVFNVYSVKEDLFKRKPYKGDMHMHTYHSDGKESPGFVTANCRKIGFDFMAITDHHRYFPSIESQEIFEGINLDMLIARGEEVHPVNNNVHIINFGGSFSINEYMKNNSQIYMNEVKTIEKQLMYIKDAKARYECASSIWVFNKIKEANGMSIFCHPYWLVRDGYYISDTVTSFMYNNQPYDANEVVGGYPKNEEESNLLQIARYYDEIGKGKKVPIVGVSDAHGCENADLFGWYYTIVFSETNNQSDIINNIRNLYSVAVENIPDEVTRPVGPFRLVKYSLFLIREVFPNHDELCYDEGQLMLKYISGDTTAKNKLNDLQGQIKKLYSDYWAKY